MKKRLSALLLTVSMVLPVLPGIAMGEEAECTHPSTVKVYPWKPTYTNTEYTPTHHTLYQVTSLVCGVCGEMLESNIPEFVRTEEHHFLPDGSCMVCGYIRQPERTDEQNNTGNTGNTSSTGNTGSADNIGNAEDTGSTSNAGNAGNTSSTAPSFNEVPETPNRDEDAAYSIISNDAEKSLSNTTVLNGTDSNGNKLYGNEFILFGDEEVKPGYIRFISQIPIYTDPSALQPARFISTQWGKRASEAGGLCTYAVLSMQLSYLGVDFTPGDMFNWYTSFNRSKIIEKAQEQAGISVGKTKVSELIPTQKKLDTMMELYETNSNYSPIYAYFEYYNPAKGKSSTHAVLIVGCDTQTGTYYLVDPQARTGMGSFQIGSDMTISNSNIPSYNGGKITSIAQAWLTT